MAWTYLLLAQRSIPVGTAHAVWTGIGDAALLVAGVVGLRLA